MKSLQVNRMGKFLSIVVSLPFLLAGGPCRGESEKTHETIAEEPVVGETAGTDPVTDDPLVADPKPQAEPAAVVTAVETNAPPVVDTVAAAGAAVKTEIEAAGTNAADVAAIALAVAKAKAVEEARLEAEARARAEEAKAKLEAEAREDEKLGRRRMSTRVFRLVHANAEEVAERFNATWSGDFGVSWKVSQIAHAFPEANAVMVTAPAMILDACQKVIDEIDREAQQVYIEARFVELGNTASHKLGIDWSMLGGMTGSVQLGGGIQSTRVGAGVTEYTRELSGKNEKTTYKVSGGGGNDGDVSYFNGTLDFSEMSLTLKALDSTDDVKVFSNPKIIVSSGKKATVDMTTKYPNVQVAAKKTFNTSGESVDLDMKMAAIPGEDKMLFAKEAFFSWGISLDVTPRVSTNGLINVVIVPTISSLGSDIGQFVTVGGDSKSETTYSSKYPIIEVQRLITEFNMASGSTAVIGGLSRTTEKQVDNGIPLLRSIPWLGPRLFGSMERVKEQKEIIVFVTVGLVDPKRMEKDAGLPKNAVLGRQYTKGQKLEPGDRPEKSMEGMDSLDMRPLEEQARDPLAQGADESFDFRSFIPFTGSSSK